MVRSISSKVREFSECIRPPPTSSTRRVDGDGVNHDEDGGFHNQGDSYQRAGGMDEYARTRINETSLHAAENTERNATENGRQTVENLQNRNWNRFSPVASEDVEIADPKTQPALPAGEHIRIWKNVLVIGLAFMIHFTAFWGASNLQSSINADEALGTFTLAAIYGALIVSNILLPAITIKWLGCKWAIALSLITYMPFIAAQFHPRFYTLIPAGLAVGLGGGPLWCAKATYLSAIAESYSQLVGGIASDAIVTRFFGVFFTFFQLSQVWGNLISSAVLSQPDETTAADIIDNSTRSVLNHTNAPNWCGANFEPGRLIEAANPNLQPPPTHQIHLIAGIYLACMLAAVLIVVFFVDSLERYKNGRTSNRTGSGLSGLRLLAVTMQQLRNPYQLLILPITMFIGAEQAFLAADYTASYVACGWGIKNIGFVMICYGVCNAFAALCTGSIAKLTGRAPVLGFATLLNTGLIIVLLLWPPTSIGTHVYFIVAGLWGVADAMWMVQINSLYGSLNPGQEEAAFCNFRLWESTGSVLTYATSPYLNMRVRLYILLGILFIGIGGYVAIEKKENGAKKRQLNSDGIKSDNNAFTLVRNSPAGALPVEL